MTPLALAVFALAADPNASPERVFEARIRPIFNSPNPSSCVQCHLAGVDLKNYIRPSHRETFLSLRDQGLVDLDRPEKSRILELIDMGAADKGAALIHHTTRKAEYEAFAAWVKASSADPELRTAPKLSLDELAKPPRPNEVIRHARKDRLLESFENSVWAMRFRCMGCHTPGTDSFAKHAAKHGAARMGWFKPAAADALAHLLGSKLVDAADPGNSLLLLKALGKEEHGGGVKFLPGDQGYKLYRRFLDDYAKTVTSGYHSTADLPKPDPVERFGTDAWLKLTDTPPEWADKLVAVKLFAWDATKGRWGTEPVAESDRKVWGQGKLWQHPLTLTAPRASDRAKALRGGPPKVPPGRYLVTVYADRAGKLAADWTAELGDADLVGQAELTSDWPGGYGKMTVLDARRVRKPAP